MHRSADQRPALSRQRSHGLGLRLRIAGASATLGHELVEFRLVLGVTQAVEERDEIALLFFEAA